jgi:NAD(P)-dependent dehydrogenase (short-subunit alcohol dehydrogenase family)
VSNAALYRLSERLAAETRGHVVMVVAIDPGLVRPAMSESAMSCGEPSIERWFKDAFANQEDVSTESAAILVVSLASGAADVLSGRNIDYPATCRRRSLGRPRLKSMISTHARTRIAHHAPSN